MDDLVDLNPFVGATNRTALFQWRRDASTVYPVRYVLWQRQKRGRIPADATLEGVGDLVSTLELVAAPVDDHDPTSAWLTAPAKTVPVLRKIAETRDPAYNAHAGVYTGANGVYWLDVVGSPDADGRVPVTNLHDIGRTKIPRKHGRVEQALVHPHLRGQDIQRWSAKPSVHLLFVQDPQTRRGIDPQTMESSYPGALAYLAQFERILRARAAFKRYYTRREGRSRTETGPYWSMFDVGAYTLATHKVVWRDQAVELTAAVLAAGEPLALPNHKVIFTGSDDAHEAHYLCGLLNSTPFRCFVASYAIETQISTHPMKYVRIPKFDRSAETHQAVAAASRTAHSAVADGREPDERAIDATAAAVWGLSASEIESMRNYLDRLLKRDAS